MICTHHTTVLRRKTTSNGAIQAIRQCTECGATTAGPIKHSEIEAQTGLKVSELPEFDRSIEDRWWSEKTEIMALERGAERRENRRLFNIKYDEYLFSSEWREKRMLVLSRDNHVCQGCLRSRATQVHHITYKHVFNELMFELVSLCSQCHDKAHAEMVDKHDS